MGKSSFFSSGLLVQEIGKMTGFLSKTPVQPKTIFFPFPPKSLQDFTFFQLFMLFRGEGWEINEF